MSHETARKIQQTILRGLTSLGQNKAAELLNTTESTVSKMKREDNGEIKVTFPGIAKLIDAMGLKLVPQEYKCYRPDYIQSLEAIAKEHFNSNNRTTPLVWED